MRQAVKFICLLSALFCLIAVVLAPFRPYQALAEASLYAQPKNLSAEYKALDAKIKKLYKAGRIEDIFRLLPRRLALFDAEIGLETERGSVELHWIVKLYLDHKQYAKALPLAKRMVALRQKIWGAGVRGTGVSRRMLADAYKGLGQLDKAERIYKEVLASEPKTLSKDIRFFGKQRTEIASVYLKKKEYARALQAYRQAARNYTSTYTNPRANTHRSLIMTDYDELGLKKALATFEGQTKSAWHVSQKAPPSQKKELTAETFSAGQWAWRTSASRAVAQMAARLGAGDSDIAKKVAAVQRLEDQVRETWDIQNQAMGAWSRKLFALPAYSRITQESQRASYAARRKTRALTEQRSKLTRALTKNARARQKLTDRTQLAQLAEKRKALKTKLAAVARKSQQAGAPILNYVVQLKAIEKQTKGYDAYQIQRQHTSKQLIGFESRLRAAKKQLNTEYPAYADLSRPQPLAIRQLQKLLKPGEALVSFLFGDEHSFAWLVGPDFATWAKVDLTKHTLDTTVTALRKGLSPVEGELFRSNGGLAFNLKVAHKLYANLLGHFEPQLRATKHLLVVPSGALQRLPLAVLVTTPQAKRYTTYEGYRKTDWLIRKLAITTLPSVPSLKALRLFAKKGRADRRPFIGFGDPVLTGPLQRSAPRGAQHSAGSLAAQTGDLSGRMANLGVRSAFVPRGLVPSPATSAPKPTPSKSRLVQPSAVSLKLLRQLYPLPDTKAELETIATLLGAAKSSVRVQEQATEKSLKMLDLSQFKVMSFATHGLITQELPGLNEPGLVLTPPATKSQTDDGILLASEIAQLKINADWVILSACNTASGGRGGAGATLVAEPQKPGEARDAEGLSGLARAFIFAGARALLVSHWPVYSDAAVDLTTGIFASQRKSQNKVRIGRAEALRRSILSMIDDVSVRDNGHPSRWAPFVLVGDGA